jgi:hypothetical protein
VGEDTRIRRDKSRVELTRGRHEQPIQRIYLKP